MSFDFDESEKALQTAFGTAGGPVRYGRPVRERLVPLEALCGTKSSGVRMYITRNSEKRHENADYELLSTLHHRRRT